MPNKNKFDFSRMVIQVPTQDGSISVPVEMEIRGGEITFRTHAEKNSIGEELGIVALEELTERLDDVEVESLFYCRNVGRHGKNRIDCVAIQLKRSGK